MNVIYTDPKGEKHTFTDPNAAMQRYAEDGFQGHIEAQKDQPPTAPPLEALLFAKVFPFHDDDADLTTWVVSPFTQVQEACSWYEDLEHAEAIAEWAAANGSPEARLTRYEGGITYDGARKAAESLNATAKPTPKTWTVQAKDLNPNSLRAEDNRPGRVTMTGTAGSVSDQAAERIARHEKALNAHGIYLPPPVYAPGSRVNDLGVSNFNLKRDKWEATPPTHEGLRETAVLIRGEDREDRDVPASAIRMRDDGALVVNGEVLQLEEQGLRAMAKALRIEEGLRDRMRSIGWEDSATLMPGAGAFLTTMDPDVRSFVVNKCIAKVDLDQDVKLRTRKGPHGKDRSVYAVTGTGFGVFDADQVAEVIADVLETGPSGLARGPVLYDGGSTTLKAEAIWMPDSIVDLAAGDIFKVGGTFRTGDAGGSAIKGGGTAWRNLCLNLIIIGEGSVEVFYIRHTGSMDEVRKLLQIGVAKIPELFKEFLQEWGFLRRTPISQVELYGKSYPNAKAAIEALVMKGNIEAGVGKAALLEYMLQSYDKEPGDSLADIVNALTRSAHEKLVSEIVRDNMERAAGKLMPVLVRAAEMAVA